MSNSLVTKLRKTKTNQLICKSSIFLLFFIVQFFVPLKSVIAADLDSLRRDNLDKAFKSYAVAGYQLMLWGADIPKQSYDGAQYTKVEYTRKVNEYIGNGLSQIVATPKEKLIKDEFETTQAFELRKKENDKKYNSEINAKESQAEQRRSVIYSEGFHAILGSPLLVSEYDADKEIFNITISSPWAKYAIKAKIKVLLAEAKETKTKMEAMIPWVVFQIYPEKVIPRGIILQNRKGDASAIKRIDFVDNQDGQSISIGSGAYSDALLARKQADEISIQENQRAANLAAQQQKEADTIARAKVISISKTYSYDTPTSTAIEVVSDLWDITQKNPNANTICLTTSIQGKDRYGSTINTDIGTFVVDLNIVRKYKDKISFINNPTETAVLQFLGFNPKSPYCHQGCFTYEEKCP